MNDFRIHTLGCGSAKPTLRHLPSCTIIEHGKRLMMVDCGEGAQLSMTKHGLRPSRLTDIFITHLHGDHVLGLPGLISTLGLGEHKGTLTIHTFEEGKRILETMFSFFAPELSFTLRFNVIKPEDGVVVDEPTLRVRSVALCHRVPAVGYIFEEKEGERHLLPEAAREAGVPVEWFKRLKQGEDYNDGTSIIPNNRLTTPPTPPRSYAHISDTSYLPDLGERIGKVDLLFHETTYLEKDKEKAQLDGHSTARQAALVAKAAGAGRLLTGHYSASITDDYLIAEEASEVFPSTLVNFEGRVTTVREAPAE